MEPKINKNHDSVYPSCISRVKSNIPGVTVELYNGLLLCVHKPTRNIILRFNGNRVAVEHMFYLLSYNYDNETAKKLYTEQEIEVADNAMHHLSGYVLSYECKL
jgi:hypothetical protein